MRTIKIRATLATERVMTEWLAHLVLAIPTGPDGGAIVFDGDLSNGIVVAQRHEGPVVGQLPAQPGREPHPPLRQPARRGPRHPVEPATARRSRCAGPAAG